MTTRFSGRAHRLVPLLTFLLWSCSGDGGTAPPQDDPASRPAQVIVSPSADTLSWISATRQLSASVLNASGVTLSSGVTWSSSATSVATVSAGGLVIAVGVGIATIVAQAGSVSGNANIVVRQVPVTVTKLSGDEQSGAVGEVLAQPLVVEVRDQGSALIAGAELNWSVTVGGGSLETSLSEADVSGKGQAIWKLGSVVGGQSAQVSSGPVSPVTFNATGQAPPSIVLQPASIGVAAGASASFKVEATGTAPLTLQWSRDGDVVEGATGATYTVAAAARPDSGAAFTVRVTNAAGSVTSDPAVLSVIGAPPGSRMGIRAEIPSGPNDLVGVRYRLKVTENQSTQGLKILFSANRFYGPGSPITYLVESNVYTNRLTYSDGGCTTWPLLGTYEDGISTLRNAIPDYPFNFGQQPQLATGIQTSDGLTYPVQSYLIDNIPNLYKSDAISQFDITGIETLITVQRGDTLSAVESFARCGRPLMPTTYRLWTLTTEMPGRPTVTQRFVMPDASARYITVNEAMGFLSEFLGLPGYFTVQYWDFAYLRESDQTWRPVSTFRTTNSYDGTGFDFGVHVVMVDGKGRIEFTNRPGYTFLRGNNKPFSF